MALENKQVIQNAVTVLEQQKTSFDEQDFKTLKKKFPAFAIRLNKESGDCSVEALNGHIQQGLDYISNYFQTDRKQQRNYSTIIDAFPKEESELVFDDDTAEAVHYANTGNIEKLKRMKEEGFGSFTEKLVNHKSLSHIAFDNGDIALLDYAMTTDGEADDWRIITDVGNAMRAGHLDIIRHVKEELNLSLDIYKHSPYTMYIRHAVVNKHWNVIDYVAGEWLGDFENNAEVIKVVFVSLLQSDQIDQCPDLVQQCISRKLLDQFEFEMQAYQNMSYKTFQSLCEDYNCFDYDTLVKISNPKLNVNDQRISELAFMKVQEHEKYSFSEKLKEKGRLLKEFCGEAYSRRGRKSVAVEINRKLKLPQIFIGSANRQAAQFYETWEKRFGEQPFVGDVLNPELVKMKTFTDVFDMFKGEGLMDTIAAGYAYHTSALFGSADRVLQYLEKWGEAANQPLHDATFMIEVPQTGKLDLKSWGDAVLQHGPKMAKFVKFSDKVSKPIRSSDDGVYSYHKTKAEVAKHSFKAGNKNPEWAQECMNLGWKEPEFKAGLGLIKKYQKQYASNDNQKPDNIPTFSLSGNEFNMPGYKFYKLPDGDYRGLALGEYTACCQHLANQGRDCAAHGFLSEQGGFYVVEDKQGQIVGQAWAWRGNQGEMTLDSLEFLSDRMNKENWQMICEKLGADLLETRSDISALNVGASGRTPALSFNTASKLAKPVDYSKYRDSDKAQYQVFKR